MLKKEKRFTTKGGNTMLQEISRRKFMELTGAGALLLTSAGMMTGCCREYPTLFGEWIDMVDLRIRFSRACYI